MKAWTILFSFLLIPLLLTASDYTLEVRTACFSPTEKKVRDIYSCAWIDFEVFVSKQISQYWQVWGEVDWTIKKGHSSRGEFGFKDRTRAWILPVSLGLRFVYPVTCRISAYAGGGLSYSFLKIDNRCEDYRNYSFYSSSPFKNHIYKNGLGGIAKVGLLIDTGDNTFIDIFADYIWLNFHLGHHHLFEERIFGRHFNASGFKFGGGFGIKF
jgi:hypothetical protein